MDSTTYHNLTSYSRYDMTPHRLDWEHVPLLQKAYGKLPSVRLKPPEALPDGSFTEVLEGQVAGDFPRPTLGLQDLSAILMLANGITAQRRYGSQTQFYRSAPSAGALYPNETYIAVGSVEGLAPGLYNHQVMDASLIALRKGSFIHQVQSALAMETRDLPAAVLPITGIFFRSAWKYRDRAFRYVLLDAGHLIENLVLAASANGYAYSVHYDFDDNAMERLLGIDPKREACLAVVNLYTKGGESCRAPEGADAETPALLKALVAASRTSTAEIQYEAIQQVCTAGNTIKPGEARMMQAYPVAGDMPRNWFPVREEYRWAEKQCLVESMLLRRSRRNFVPIPMLTSQAMHLMQSLCLNRGPAADGGIDYGGYMTSGIAAINIEAFDPGIYLLDTREKAYSLVSGGSSGEKVARVCLDQEWLKNGSLHFLFMANLRQVDRHMGARGYRYAMLNAGRAGQRIYLAATALGLGACGIGALYDAEARQMLALNDESSLLYLVGVGRTKSTFRIPHYLSKA
ncbi:MAG: SagB/ThcOx family dehydrogenase [Thermodesulfobacteriota bacterium]